MPKLSLKASTMPSSPIRKLVPYAEAAKEKGIQVIHLNIGQPDIETPRVAMEAIKNTDIKVLEYSNSAGIQSYREGLVDYYARNGHSLTTDNIIVTTGGSEAINFAFLTCLNPGDEIIIPEPFYANYNGFAHQAGIVINPITAYIDNGFALPPIEDFEKKITARTKAILICNPSNPTGNLYTREELEKLAELVKKYDLFLFADEVYREFYYTDQKPYSVLNLKEIENQTVLIDSVSKRYSMCGARIGAFVSRSSAIIEGVMRFAQARLSPPTFAQIAAEGALKTPQEYFDNVKKEYILRRDIIVDGLRKIRGVKCPRPNGAFYCIAELPVKNAEDFCKWLLEEFEYEGNTVMMAPLSGFYATTRLGKKEVRIAYVLEKEQLEKALVCLEKALEIYPNTVYQDERVLTEH